MNMCMYAHVCLLLLFINLFHVNCCLAVVTNPASPGKYNVYLHSVPYYICFFLPIHAYVHLYVYMFYDTGGWLLRTIFMNNGVYKYMHVNANVCIYVCMCVHSTHM